MRLTSTMVCALLAAGLVGWAGCDNNDATTGTDTNNTGNDARTAGERTTPDSGVGGMTGGDTTGTSGTGTATPTTGPSDRTGTGMGSTPTTSPSDTTGGTGAGMPR